MTRKTVLIGRSAHADIVIADGGVDAHHAELVVTARGRLYLTDRGSGSGTFLRDEAGWGAVRQTFIEDADEVRFGGFECTGAELRRRVSALTGDDAARTGAAGRGSPQLRGAVERDPATGEIVRRKF